MAEKRIRVLVSDDSASIRRRVVQLLSEIPSVNVVRETEDVAGTLEAVQAVRPDIVVLDMQMPDGSGIDVLKYVKREMPDTKVIMLTNHASDFYRRKCIDTGADFFFDKTTEFECIRSVFDATEG